MQSSHPAPDAEAIARLEAELAHLDRELESLRLLRESQAVTVTVVLLVPFLAVRALPATFLAHPFGAAVSLVLLAVGLHTAGRTIGRARAAVLEEQQQRIVNQLETIHQAGQALGPILEPESWECPDLREPQRAPPRAPQDQARAASPPCPG